MTKDVHKTRVVTITNIRGGCAKTTNILHMAITAAKEKHRVLVVDTDPQFHATRSLRKDLDGTGEGYIDQALGGALPQTFETTVHGLSLLPSRIEMNLIQGNPIMRSATWVGSLQKALSKLEGEPFDWIFIDTPATYSPVHALALFASDYYLISLRPEAFSFVGYMDSQTQIQAAKRDLMEASRKAGNGPLEEEEVWLGRPRFGGFILSQVNQGVRIGVREIREGLMQSGTDPLVLEIPESSLFDNVRWKDTDTMTIFDLKGKKRGVDTLIRAYHSAWKRFEKWAHKNTI